MGCVIVSAGPLGERAMAQIHQDDYIIACDGGWKRLEQWNTQPHLVVGDFDSSHPPKGMECICLPTEKDDTDTHYAARLAVQKGYTQIIMLGALGGARMEHTFANIATALWLARQGCKVSLVDENSRVYPVLSGQCFSLAYDPAVYLSIFPLQSVASGVSLKGTKYPMQDGTLNSDYPIGVSNEILADGAEIQAGQGDLLVIVTQKDNQLGTNEE